MSERITAQVPESNIVNQSTHTTTAQHTTQQIQTIFPFWESVSIWYNILHYSVISSTIKQDPTLSRIPHIKSSYRTTAPFSFTRIFSVSTRQPDITIRSVRSHYQTQPTPGTQNTTHQITARHNKKPIGQYKPMDCITHGSL